MGLFDDERVDVFSSIQPLITAPEDPLVEAILHGKFAERSMRDTIYEYAATGMCFKAQRAYNYGYDHYTLGIPQTTLEGASPALQGAVKAAIESEIGQQIQLIYAYIKELTPVRALFPWLIENRGFDPADASVATDKFTEHFTLREGAILPVKVKYAVEISPGIIQLTYVYQFVTAGGADADPSTLTQYEVERVPLPSNMHLGEPYAFAAYTVNGDIQYWFYRLYYGPYHDIYNAYNNWGDKGYMPIVPIRRNNTDLTVDQSNELYETSKELLSKFDVDIDQVATTLNESENSADVDHAYVICGVDLLSDQPEVIKYLYHYFYFLFSNAEVSEEEAQITPTKYNKIMMERISGRIDRPDESLLEHGLNIGVGFDYITPGSYSGSIGPVGTATREITLDYGMKDKEAEDGTTIHGFFDDSTVTLRYQVESSYYYELTVVGLQFFNEDIYDGEDIITPLYKAVEDTKNKIIIPVHYGIASAELTVMERNVFYYHALQIVMNSYVITELAWYEQGWFSFLIAIVSVILFVWTAGQSKWLLALKDAVAAGTMALVKYVLGKVIMSMAVNKIVKIVAKELGAEESMVFGAILTAISYFYGAGGGSASFNFGGIAITASSFVSAGMALMNAGADVYQDLIANVQKEMAAFEEEAEEKMEYLEDLAEDLLGSSLIDPLIFTEMGSPQTVPDESPSDFYERTIHTGNIGVLALDMIGNYVDSVVKLPKPSIV